MTTQNDVGSASEEHPSAQKKLLIILIGAPGSGKGTQAGDIVRSYGVVHISTGDMLRAEIKKGSSLGIEAKSYIDKGELVPDSLIVNMLKERMKSDDCRKGVLLDGFPRTVSQAEALQKMADEEYMTAAIFLDVSDDTVISRITGRRSCSSCGAIYHVTLSPSQKEGVCDKCDSPLITRSDDSEATVRARLRVFHEQTAPVVAFYKDRGLLTVVNGEQSPQAVTQECAQALNKELAKAH